MKLDQTEIKTEVEKAIRLCEEIRREGKDIDLDDIQHYAEKIELVLKRVQKDLLRK